MILNLYFDAHYTLYNSTEDVPTGQKYKTLEAIEYCFFRIWFLTWGSSSKAWQKSTNPIRIKTSLNAELSYLHCSSKHHGPLCYNSAIRFLYRNEILLSLECSMSSTCSSANSIDVKCTLRWHQEASLDHLQHPPNSLFPSPSSPLSLFSLFSLFLITNADHRRATAVFLTMNFVITRSWKISHNLTLCMQFLNWFSLLVQLSIWCEGKLIFKCLQ